MFRISLFKHVTQKQFINCIVLQNNLKRNNTFGFQSMSSVNLNLTQTLKKQDLKQPQYEKPSSNLTENKHFSDKEYFVRLKNDPDKFGPPLEKEVVDEGDVQEEKYFTEQPSPSQKLRTKQYADIIKSLIRQRKIKEAIDVVEVRMLKEDRVKPENYLYNLLLGACGRVGYTYKAFKLYNQMKKRGLNVTGGTYTALFNACANSPWPTTDGLKRATHLYNIMIEKGYEPNDTNYNAMIKAFGRCGDLPMAFKLVDEMCSKCFKIKNDTINFLLQACISDKEAGFRHALLVWRKLVNKNITPSVYTYNLMLRCIRDCGLGDIEVTQDVINKIVSKDQYELLENDEQKLLMSGPPSENVETSHKTENMYLSVKNSNLETVASPSSESINSNFENTTLNMVSNASIVSHKEIKQRNSVKVKDLGPNLMAPVPHLGNLISLSEIIKPEERLLLVGGSNGFLENMKQNKCSPDIKTFTQLLDDIPSTLDSEEELLLAMKKFKVKPDIDFYNMLIKKRCMRHDFENAKDVLKYMKKHRYQPNLMTYGVLALSCKTKEDALELLNEMKTKSYRLNIQILGAMLHQACYHFNFGYLFEIMEMCVKENIKPSKKFMNILQEFMQRCSELQKANELPGGNSFGILKARHKIWVQEVEVDDEEDVHPWQQYRQENDQDIKYYKWKDGTRFKPRHASLFRVKTSTKHKN